MYKPKLKEVAKELNVSPQYISAIITGKNRCTKEIADKLKEYYKVDFEAQNKKKDIHTYKIKKEYETIVDAVEGYSGRDYEENLEKFRKELEEKGCFIDYIIPVRSIVVYSKPKEILGDKENE